MKAERARLRRLQRLERVRDIAKQTAAMEAAEAEGTLAQLLALADRTRQLAADYAARSEARDGASLQQMGRFSFGLQAIAETTSGDADRARVVANAKLADLGAAERRRAAVEERILLKIREIQKRNERQSIEGRRGIGTGLE